MTGADDAGPGDGPDDGRSGDGGDRGYFEELSVGDTLTTKGRTITEADVVNFAGVTGDFSSLHTDAEAMAETEFGERIAHGALVFSVMIGLLRQSRPPAEREAIVAFYGVDRLRFVAPVFFGDTVHVEVAVGEKDRRDHPEATGLVRYEADVVNQDGETVIACELLSLLR